jgi:hypothetical protein
LFAFNKQRILENHPCPLLEGRKGAVPFYLDRKENVSYPVLFLVVQQTGRVPLLFPRRGQGWFSAGKPHCIENQRQISLITRNEKRSLVFNTGITGGMHQTRRGKP